LKYLTIDLGIYAVYPSRKHLSAKVRTFVDFLVGQLVAPEPGLPPGPPAAS